MNQGSMCANSKHPEMVGGEISARAHEPVLGTCREALFEDKVLDYYAILKCCPVQVDIRFDAYPDLVALITEYTALSGGNGALAGYASEYELNLIASWSSAGVEKIRFHGTYLDRPVCSQEQLDLPYTDIDRDLADRQARLHDFNITDKLSGIGIDPQLVIAMQNHKNMSFWQAAFISFYEQGIDEKRQFIEGAQPETLYDYLSRLSGLRKASGDFWNGTKHALRGWCGNDAVRLALSYFSDEPQVGVKKIDRLLGYDLL